MAKIMRCCSDTICCFCPPAERGLEAEALAEAVQSYYRQVQAVDTAEQAVQLALQQAAVDNIIVSFGSLSTVKAVQDAVQQWEVQHGTSDETC